MRADAHYVDLLTSRPSPGRERTLSAREIEAAPLADASTIRPLVESISRHGVLQPLLVQNHEGRHRLIAGHKRLSAAIAAGVMDVPCRLYDVDDDEAARIAAAAQIPSAAVPAPVSAPPTGDSAHGTSGFTMTPHSLGSIHADGDLEKVLTSLTACTDFVSSAESELSRTVANTLLRAEVWRAACLLKATRVLREPSSARRSTVPVQKILDQVVNGFAPERRLRMLEFDVKSSLPSDSVMVTDERLLTIAVSSAVRATLGVLEEGRAAAVKIAVTTEGGELLSFAVSQNAAGVHDTWASRAFDPSWTDRPGGQAALVSLLAVRQAAVALGGQAKVAAAGRGTSIVVTVPGGF